MQLRQDLPAEDLDPLLLVAADVVQVDPVEAEVGVALDVGAVDVGVRRDHHAALEVLRPDEGGQLGEVVGGADVRLRELHPPVGPLGDRVRQGLGVRRGPGQMDLEHLEHRVGVLARLARTLREPVEQPADLLQRRADGDDPVREPPGLR